MKKLVVEKAGPKAYEFFKKYVDVDSIDTLVVSTTNDFNIINHPIAFNTIINLSKINNIRYINKFFEKINATLQNGDILISCMETYSARRERILLTRIPVIKHFYMAMEFVFLRMFPKMWGLKKIYFLLTRGRNRILSKAEGLGRLVSCGFDIVAYESFDNLLYIVARKIGEPAFNMNASYGLLYKMPRIGKNGKKIGVYKFRTMHPYAEYLQDYVLRVNGYSDTGKPANDFRLTPWGKFLRRYWLDELPQVLNLLKGDLKLVGVRPISERYFQDIPEDLQKLRLSQKPGCIPPYVALNREGNVEAVLQAEREYLQEKQRNPYLTDTKFFLKAIFNIIFRNKRSA